MIQAPRTVAELLIDLDAIVGNWRRLKQLAAPAECAAVVKANAYGMGDLPVARALFAAGCRAFYVANLNEALNIAPQLKGARIFILNGVGGDELALCRGNGFIPVVSSLQQAAAWRACNESENAVKACVVQVDTGMNRLGLNLGEWRQLISESGSRSLGAMFVMSHLACAEDESQPLNGDQLARFNTVAAEAKAWAPAMKASFANSSGVMLGADYHFDQVRCGIALYGGNPQVGRNNQFDPVLRLRLPVLQLRCVEADGSVGYGARAQVKAGAILATVHSGYADGLLIAQSQQGWGEIAGYRVPMLGRISMDLTIFDLSAVPETLLAGSEPLYIEVLNQNLTVDHMAEAADTISYEVLTRLGSRFERRYLPQG